MAFVTAVDIGGTFTDCTIIDDSGTHHISKARTTPEAFEEGFFNSLEKGAEKFGMDLETLLDQTTRITHGTTIATNAVVEEEGSDIGVITTKGHEDTIAMMRGSGRATGEPPENIFASTDPRPEPLVADAYIRGVTERVDSEGEVVVGLNEAELEAAVDDLVAKGVDGVAVSFLWSFANPAHEQRARELVEEKDLDLFVSLSHEVSSSLGEYERTIATCLNSMLGPLTEDYITSIESKLHDDYGYDGAFFMMGTNGGCYTPAQAMRSPIMLIGSGPVGGVMGARSISDSLSKDDVLATDMGGTSFELGIIRNNRPISRKVSVINKYRYEIPKLDVESIGTGGGSIAQVQENRLLVGPKSAGSDPGPACYGRGGEQPTVTDANLVLGFIDPETTFGTEEFTPSVEAAEEALDTLTADLGLSRQEIAAGILEVTNTKMANLIKQNVTEKGFHPNDFDLVSYGGAGPMHAAHYSDQLGVNSVIVPGDYSSVWSSYGMVNTDIRQELQEEFGYTEPFDPANLESEFSALEATGREGLLEEGFDESEIKFERWAMIRFQGQHNELEVQVPQNLTYDDKIGRAHV